MMSQVSTVTAGCFTSPTSPSPRAPQFPRFLQRDLSQMDWVPNSQTLPAPGPGAAPLCPSQQPTRPTRPRLSPARGTYSPEGRQAQQPPRESLPHCSHLSPVSVATPAGPHVTADRSVGVTQAWGGALYLTCGSQSWLHPQPASVFLPDWLVST